MVSHRQAVVQAQQLLGRTPLGWEAALEYVADVIVPRVSQHFVVSVESEDDPHALSSVLIRYRDPAKEAAYRQLEGVRPLLRDGPSLHEVVYRTGRSRLCDDSGELERALDGVSSDVRALLVAASMDRAASIALQVRGQPFGVLTLGSDHDHPQWFTEADLPLLEELANTIGIAIDNARQHRRAEQALAVSRRLLAEFSTVLDSAPIGIGLYDRELRYLRCNPALAAIDGFDGDEMIGRSLEDLAPDVAAQVNPSMREVLDTGVPEIGMEVSGFTPAAPEELRHWLVSHVPVPDKGGEVAAVAAIVVEVTEERRIRDALDARVRQQEAITRLGAEAISATSVQPVVDQALATVAECLPAPLLIFAETLPTSDAIRVRAARTEAVPEPEQMPEGAAILAGIALTDHTPAVITDAATDPRLAGRPLADWAPASGVAVPIAGRGGGFGVLCAFRREPAAFGDADIAYLTSVAAVVEGAIGRTQADEQLARAQRLEAVGRLAGGLAHDFNNLLTVVMGNADLLTTQPDPATYARAVADIRGASARASGVARQILTFSRGTPTPRSNTSLAPVVRELHPLLSSLLRTDVHIQVDIPDTVNDAIVRLSRQQLEQVIMNLAINARDAMPDGGQLHIRVEPTDHDTVRISVTDTGHGMDPEVRARALEPFYSTKPEEFGSGLGLATVWALVHEAGGDVTIDSDVGVGTRIDITLPKTIEAPPPAEPAASQPARPRASHNARILLVEDQPSIRSLVDGALTAQGFHVTAAADGHEACDVDVEPDLLITDCVMPGMNGPQVARTLRGRWPNLAVLYTSGFSPVIAQDDLLAEGHFLPKPFGLADLLSAIHETLGPRTSAPPA